MKSFCFSSPELLEQRIAPAGLLTVHFLHGLLTIDGADGADHDVSIVQTGLNSFRVDGHTTAINVAGRTSQSFAGLLTDVRFDGGTGADTLGATNLNSLHSFTFNGKAGVDTLTTQNLRVAAGGRVDISIGSESGSILFSGAKTALHGPLNVDLGGGGTVTFASAVTSVAGVTTITGGSQSDTVSITAAAATFTHQLTFVGGDGDDSFTASGKSLTIRGPVALDGGAGTNHFILGADSNVFGTSTTAGSVVVKLGTGPGSLSFLGNSTKLLGALTVDLGPGGGTAQVNSAVSTIRNSVQVTGGAGNDMIEFKGSASVGGGVSFIGNAGDDTFKASGGLFSVIGATSIDGGTGASIFDLDVVSIALASLTVRGGASNDTVSIKADGTISGDVNLALKLDGTDPSRVHLASRAGHVDGLKFGGNLSLDMLGATVDELQIANIRVAKSFDAQTGENVSTVDISNLNTIGNVRLLTGAGADVVNVDNITARDLYIDTETGADELRIERNPLYTGPSNILGIATILTGIGADEIRIGNSVDAANLKVVFGGAMTLDAGDGPNMRNDIAGSNSFVSAPAILSTGGILTETAAI